MYHYYTACRKECRTQPPLVHNILSKHVFLADDKMDVRTFIADIPPKISFQSLLDDTFLS